VKINIKNIPDTGLEIKGSRQVRVEGMGNTDADLDLRVLLIAEDVFVSGGVSTSVGLECSRCLGGFPSNISLNLNLAYCQEPGDAEDKEVDSGDMNTGFLVGDELDLEEVIAEQILLGVPMKPLCSEECKGFCPKCGVDLNNNDCDCDRSYINPQFLALKDYLKKDKE